jgi:cysteinyl-tRNA synthetase
MEDDMNVPESMVRIVSFVKDSLAKPRLDEAEKGEIKFILGAIEKVIGIVHLPPLPERSMEVLLDLRNELRKGGDYGSADRIRDTLKSQGIRIEDTAEGSYVWW